MKRLAPLTLSLLFALSLIPALSQAGPRGSMRENCPERPEPEWVDPDTDNNCIISESEAAAAIERMAEHRREVFEWRNECVLERFDADDDGELAGDELERAQAARERIRDRLRERRGQRRGQRRGGEGGNRMNRR